MRPVPIPDHQLFPGAKRITVGAPRGAESWCGPLEALWVESPSDERPSSLMALVELDEVDLKALEQPEGNRFWVIFHGPISPFQFANYLPYMQREHDHDFVACGDPEAPTEMCLRCGITKEEWDA